VIVKNSYVFAAEIKRPTQEKPLNYRGFRIVQQSPKRLETPGKKSGIRGLVRSYTKNKAACRGKGSHASRLD